MGFNCLMAAEPLRGGSLLFANKFHLINICSTSERWKVEPTLEPPSGFGDGNPGLGIQRLNHKAITSILYATIFSGDFTVSSLKNIISIMIFPTRNTDHRAFVF